MEKIDEQLNNLATVEIPEGFHQSVMRRAYIQNLRPVFFVILTLLMLNFLVIVWHINAKLIDAEFADMVGDFLGVFNFNFSFISVVLNSFFEIVSPLLILSGLLSLIGAIYTGRKINFYFAK